MGLNLEFFHVWTWQWEKSHPQPFSSQALLFCSLWGASCEHTASMSKINPTPQPSPPKSYDLLVTSQIYVYWWNPEPFSGWTGEESHIGGRRQAWGYLDREFWGPRDQQCGLEGEHGLSLDTFTQAMNLSPGEENSRRRATLKCEAQRWVLSH